MSAKYELFDSTAKELEQQELEVMTTIAVFDGIANVFFYQGTAVGPALADVHGQLLSIYLCNFDL